MNEAKYREAEKRLWDSTGKQPSERFVRLPQLGVKVRVQEVGSGPPALFIHGGPNSGSMWAPLVEHIDGFRCLILDRPGTGLSERFAWDKKDLTRLPTLLATDTLDALELDRAHVVASSFGGY